MEELHKRLYERVLEPVNEKKDSRSGKDRIRSYRSLPCVVPSMERSNSTIAY
jgi:hypothetical protein